MNFNDALIFKILRYVRDHATDIEPLDIPDCSQYDRHVIAYHVKMCIQAGWIEEWEPALLKKGMRIKSLTYSGHQHLKTQQNTL